MRNYFLLLAAILFALGTGMIARHGWLEKDQGYFFLGAVLLAGAVVATVRVAAKIVMELRTPRR